MINFSYINDYSWKCLLGPQSKNINIVNDIYFWEVGKKKHFATSKQLTNFDLDLFKEKMSFHYLTKDNLDFLSKSFKITKDKNISVILDISNKNYSGRHFHGIRNAINKCNNKNFEILNDYKSIDDVKVMIDEWSNTFCEKYFRDFSGKNLYFIKNNLHKNCINKFIYDKNKLVAFGILSQNYNNTSSYIIGKALAKSYPGLSEYADHIMYEEARKLNIQYVNTGQATKGLIKYKKKFPSSSDVLHFNGTIDLK